jgi:hypothetical protein
VNCAAAGHVTEAAYSWRRNKYVLQSSMCPRAQRKHPEFREFHF